MIFSWGALQLENPLKNQDNHKWYHMWLGHVSLFQFNMCTQYTQLNINKYINTHTRACILKGENEN